MPVRIVIDSSCDLPPAEMRELADMGIPMVPLLCHFGMETIPDKSIPMSEFLTRAARTWPTTAAPSVGAFTEAFRPFIEAGEQVVCITLTAQHSSSFSSANLAGQQFPPDQIAVVDSENLSLGQGLVVLAAARAAREGADFNQVMDTIRDVRSRVHLFIALDTVEYVVKGGRVSKLSGALAALLKIRPILTLQDGDLKMIQKPRGRKAAMEQLVALARAHLPAEMVGVAHIACPALAEELVTTFARETGYPQAQILLAETGAVIATHGGPGVLGIGVVTRR
jgi:DegV family protein with EDD domain